jgi:hypothetical protein
MQNSRESAAFAKAPLKFWRVATEFANVAAGYFRQTCDILFNPAGSFLNSKKLKLSQNENSKKKVPSV